MQECLATLLQKGSEALLGCFHTNSSYHRLSKWNEKAVRVEGREQRGTAGQLTFVKRLQSQFTEIAKKSQQLHLIYVAKKVVLSWVNYLVLAKLEFCTEESQQLDVPTLDSAARVFQDVLEHCNILCEQVWEDYGQQQMTGSMVILKFLRNDDLIIPLLTSLMGCRIEKCHFNQMIQLSNVQNAI